MDHLVLTKELLDVGNVNSLVVDPTCGAVSFFVGTTRDNFDGKKVLMLEYEAYEPMALKEMKAICLEIRTCWSDIVNIAIFHRIGVVPVCEASVIIAVSSPHRKSSLEAVSFAIEELKKRVPIWKKERYDNHDSEWKENVESSVEWNNRRSLNILNCKVDDKDNVSPSLIQICVENQEIKRRIQCFVEKKREENDLNNILDYTMFHANKDPEGENNNLAESTCARTNTTVIKQEGSKCHLKVQRAVNRIGPQLKPDYLLTLDKLMLSKNVKVKEEPFPYLNLKKTSTPVLQQRIESIEDYLCLPLQSMDTNQRLKNIEKRLLYLESISPEYKHFLVRNNRNAITHWKPKVKKCSKPTSLQKRKQYTVSDLNKIINQIKKQLQ